MRLLTEVASGHGFVIPGEIRLVMQVEYLPLFRGDLCLVLPGILGMLKDYVDLRGGGAHLALVCWLALGWHHEDALGGLGWQVSDRLYLPRGDSVETPL